ncbi:M23 family metallopeptidase [Cellulomonas sp. Y8]|uniref:M23 family metallopeptidase n=1 Tax=Cellulomonas sp. Y8 TaxID=2591145 RepID=UPI003D73D8B4
MSEGSGKGMGLIAAAVGFVVAPILALVSCGVVVSASGQMLADCEQMAQTAAVGVTVDVGSIGSHPELSASHLSGDAAVRMEQLRNAGFIMNAAAALGLNSRAQEIGVMTAIGESSLRVIDYGDAAGPDSRGLFQQRDNGAWGSYADRMDPFVSATNFFKALMRVSGWEQMTGTAAAHAVQRNADPYHYEKYETSAKQIVAALAGTTIDPDVPAECRPAGIPVITDGWTKPAPGARGITSRFGMRLHPIFGDYRLHAGTDLGAACGTPIYAAAAGTVIAANGAGTSSQRDLVRIDHGSGLNTLYMHMYPSGIFVHPGDVVSAGDLIAAVGNAGSSTACHLHYEVRTNGTAIDPVPFMQERGVTLP